MHHWSVVISVKIFAASLNTDSVLSQPITWSILTKRNHNHSQQQQHTSIDT